MVLQRGAKVNVWGTAEPKQKLLIKFDSQEIETQADEDGCWAAAIQTPSQPGGPFDLEVGAVGGETKVVFSDVMVGEVWICAGGTNMDWDVSKVLNSKNEIELSKNFQQLRIISVNPGVAGQPLDDFSKVQPWSVCAPETVKDFSATAYFFGRELSKSLERTPIGLIEISRVGAPCESWCSNAALQGSEQLKPLMDWWQKNEEPTSFERPGSVFNAMVAPMRKFSVAGVVWHQGEANNGRGDQYATLLPALIQDWRNQFSNQNLPFYLVQIPPYRYETLASDSLPEIWDAQLKTVKSIPHTGLAMTTDISNPKERSPANKQEVGRRLSILALADLYKARIKPENLPAVSTGPLLKSHTKEGRCIRVKFDQIGGGLQVREGSENLAGFMICGQDREFFPAKAVIVGDEVEVTSPDVADPVEVRYGWSDTFQPNLTNSEGLPASPFRTDKFDLQSKGRHF